MLLSYSTCALYTHFWQLFINRVLVLVLQLGSCSDLSHLRPPLVLYCLHGRLMVDFQLEQLLVPGTCSVLQTVHLVCVHVCVCACVRKIKQNGNMSNRLTVAFKEVISFLSLSTTFFSCWEDFLKAFNSASITASLFNL